MWHGEGAALNPAEDITRLSPLKHRNLNVLGRYGFAASTQADGGLRLLRDPDAPPASTRMTAPEADHVCHICSGAGGP
ncbi:hypothetical protein LRD69_16990 [Streptomyces sp. JH14]|uniref:hypothetical protein n=1 Tax=Streptomyces sp. JH14 TaxID=2793630 RepID=UPI0023F832D4|nr:hypothetical protein [Streptomyces sp. JH14]MDF6043794.1 hypothetical protein [Streptomyces sp. JH14]